MTRIGILCPGAIGHLNPMCNLGIELQSRGHTITLFGAPEVEEQISQSGLGFHEIGADVFPPGSMDPIYAQIGQLTGSEGLKFIIQLFEKEARMLFRDAPEAIREAGIEMLLIDQVTFPGGTIADYLSLPFITICSSLPTNSESGVPPSFTHWSYKDVWWSKLRNQLGNILLNYLTREVWNILIQQRKEWHLPLYKSRADSGSRLAHISQLPRDLDFPRTKLTPWFHYTGPLKNPSDVEPVSLDKQSFSFEKLNDKPLIYATLGTLQSHNWEIFRYIAEACLDIDAQLVISLGNPKANLSKANFPGNPLIAAFPPHQKLINRSALVITHAGSTAVSCLSSGVPMVAIPITADQPGMAARIAWTGTGEVIPLKRLRVPRLRKAIKRVLTNDAYRQSALKLQAAIDQAGGVRRAADIIEQAIATGEPVIA